MSLCRQVQSIISQTNKSPLWRVYVTNDNTNEHEKKAKW